MRNNRERALAVTGLCLLVAFFLARNRIEQLQLTLDTERAITATGLCGHQFKITGLGKNKDEMAIAGTIVKVEKADHYFIRHASGHDPFTDKLVLFEEIYGRTDDGSEYLMLRRPLTIEF